MGRLIFVDVLLLFQRTAFHFIEVTSGNARQKQV